MEYKFDGDFKVKGRPLLLKANHPTASGETGWRVWDAGMILGQYLEDKVAGKTVLDIGCGSGVAAIAAALCGGDVTMTDKAAIQARTEHNLALNEESVTEAGGKAVFRVLDWQALPAPE